MSTRDCLRARLLLLRAHVLETPGRSYTLAVCTSTATVNKWSQRFVRLGLGGLVDRSCRGPKSQPCSTVVLEQVNRQGGQARVRHVAVRSTRTTADELGISASQRRLRIWREHGLKPDLKRTFKLSNDPQFEAKF